jgi:hypothetical protein
MPCRYHKVKPVREATLETIKLLKETGPIIEEAEMAMLEERPLKINRGTGVGYKSPNRVLISGAVVAPLITSRTNTFVDNKTPANIRNEKMMN